MSYRIGLDGGGTKTECLVVDLAGRMVATRVVAGCNPSVLGTEQASAIALATLGTLRDDAAAHFLSTHGHAADPHTLIDATLLCMAGHRSFWNDFATSLRGFGRVTTTDDSRPVLEFATDGLPGLVLHSGTGSFVAALAPDKTVHYAGGLGWRFGDPGSGYDLGSRAIARGLLEIQGWLPASPLGALVRERAQSEATADASALNRFFYQQSEPTRTIAALAPAVLQLAVENCAVAREIVTVSAGGLLDLGIAVATKLFPANQISKLRVGLSGPILNHPVVREALVARAPFELTSVTAAPIEGVRRLL
ncbi:MAG: ATPase BadF/BadG/BcrA/BcrD type [Verrucomicrobia bacterium]|nr:ATPase BadF/BadG/BcrA/BcrD type [Verrucomicrobiota bacterium]